MEPFENGELVARFQTSECTTFARGLDHPECVAIGADGSLFAGGEAGEIYRITTDGTVTQFATALGESGGIALDAQGNLYECNLSGHLNRITPDGELTVYSTGTAELPAFFPNYPVFDQHGNLFFTDSGEWTRQDGRIYVVRPDGTSELAFPDYLGFPNGLALDSDEGWLYLVQSNLHNVARIKISDGELVGRAEIYAEFPTTTVPDGIALTESRDLYVAFYDPSVIYVVEPSGRIDVLLEGLAFDLLNRPTNITFSRETTHMYYPNYGTGEIVRLDVGEKGMPLHYPQLPATS